MEIPPVKEALNVIYSKNFIIQTPVKLPLFYICGVRFHNDYFIKTFPLPFYTGENRIGYNNNGASNLYSSLVNTIIKSLTRKHEI